MYPFILVHSRVWTEDKGQCKSKHVKNFKNGDSNLLIFQSSHSLVYFKLSPAKGIHQDVIYEPGI